MASRRQQDPLIIPTRVTYQSLSRGVNRAQTQVRRKDLPYDLGLKPNVRLRAPNLDVPAWSLHLQRLERLIMRLKRLVAEAGADLTNGLILLRVGVVTSEQERAVDVCTLALAIVSADDHEIERVAYTRKVVLLELQSAKTC